MTPHHSGVFFLNFQQISHISLMFPLLTLNKHIPARLILVQLYVLSHYYHYTNIHPNIYLLCFIHIEDECNQYTSAFSLSSKSDLQVSKD